MSNPSSEKMVDTLTSNPLKPVEGDNPIDPQIAEIEQYTLLSSTQRTCIGLLVGIATMFSPLTANIYLPCLPLLQSDFATTPQLINMTVTGYVLVQALAPAFSSQLAETLGRRPVYLGNLTIFAAASLGLAFLPSPAPPQYATLLALRMLQSLGASAATALGYAVVADIAAPAERGRIMAVVMVTVNLGPVIAPVVGGPICGHAGWRYIFWLLAATGLAFLTAMGLLLPETNRRLVGNGGIEAPSVVNKPVLRWLVPRAECYGKPTRTTYASSWQKVVALSPNPLKSVVIIFQKDTFWVLLCAGTFYMLYYVAQASLPALFREAYGYSETEIGLCYLALSLGVIISSQLQARLMDWNYRVTAKKIGWEIDRTRGDDLSRFPIERARARLSPFISALQCAFCLAYGWSIHYRLHTAVPLVFQFLQEICGFVQTWNTLTVEIHRDSPSIASAAGNLVRCLMAAGGVAVMEPLMRTLGVGPFFTLLSGVCCIMAMTGIYFITRHGMKWRLEREQKTEASTET